MNILKKKLLCHSPSTAFHCLVWSSGWRKAGRRTEPSWGSPGTDGTERSASSPVYGCHSEPARMREMRPALGKWAMIWKLEYAPQKESPSKPGVYICSKMHKLLMRLLFPTRREFLGVMMTLLLLPIFPTLVESSVSNIWWSSLLVVKSTILIMSKLTASLFFSRNPEQRQEHC